MDNIYGSWDGYMKRIREFERSGQPEALFPLPNGKTMGEASPEEIQEFRLLWEQHSGFARDENWTGSPDLKSSC